MKRVACLWALMACGDEPIVPDYPDWLLEQIPLDTASVVPTHDCNGADQGFVSSLTVVNGASAPRVLYAVDAACVEVFVAALQPGEQHLAETGPHQVWTAKTSGGVRVHAFQVPVGQSAWTEVLP